MPTRVGNVLSWASTLEPEALAQATRAAELPFVAGPVALMPDAHVGIGSTVGAVIPTREAVIPAAVGVDIGCGMIAVETDLADSHLPDSLDPLLSRLGRVVPAGVGKGHQKSSGRQVDVFKVVGKPASELTDKQRSTAIEQFGSLGSGNHFVEVCLDERGVVWVVLHSGSRGIGNQLAMTHIEKAKGLMKGYVGKLPDPDLAHLVEGTPEFARYIGDMLWAQDYALANRDRMMNAVLRELFTAAGRGGEVARINCHHNFTQKEHHLGQDVWLTRKGAIQARRGDLGVIPGSMGTQSYVVEGLGNPESYESCSHGAGRRLSRGAARRGLDVEGLHRAMTGKTWNAKRAAALIDEDPRAYKDIDQVMADQRDLVRIVHTLRQTLNYKG